MGRSGLSLTSPVVNQFVFHHMVGGTICDATPVDSLSGSLRVEPPVDSDVVRGRCGIWSHLSRATGGRRASPNCGAVRVYCYGGGASDQMQTSYCCNRNVCGADVTVGHSYL